MAQIRYFYYPQTGFISWGYAPCNGVEIPYDLYHDMSRRWADRQSLYAEWLSSR